ncbi:SpoIIE family protein phosphatase [Paractinoplanes rishiriensis]|uniref:PPM-type phosphatase domain-containing protein n=1 Tax=Paractinoplanes rishiriensis TaxID=1050105 RepID=A0A919K5Z3_9ACTN|nr:SpoIIE family protein phosphatase [Actinoplanes rishiriensis]GIF01506.1 hypothetical protein Ari01nite_89700 [Actinoplanes rishiriensis]
MGRGLGAAPTSSATPAATRGARRDGGGLTEMTRAADAAIGETFPDVRFVTGVLADPNLETGELRYVTPGIRHPSSCGPGGRCGGRSGSPTGADHHDAVVAGGADREMHGARCDLEWPAVPRGTAGRVARQYR